MLEAVEENQVNSFCWRHWGRFRLKVNVGGSGGDFRLIVNVGGSGGDSVNKLTVEAFEEIQVNS